MFNVAHDQDNHASKRCNSLFAFNVHKSKLAASVMMLAMLIAVQAAYAANNTTTSTTGSVTSALCSVYNPLRNIILLLALTIIVLGALLYMVSNIMSKSSGLNGKIQGYGVSMIIAGIVGVAIAVAVPFVLNLISHSVSAMGLC